MSESLPVVTDLKLSQPSSDEFFGFDTPVGYHWYRVTCRVNGERYAAISMINDDLICDQVFLAKYFENLAIEHYREDSTK